MISLTRLAAVRAAIVVAGACAGIAVAAAPSHARPGLAGLGRRGTPGDGRPLHQVTASAASTPERLADVRVQGNYATSDEEVLQIAGVSLGEVLPAGAVEVIEARLRASGRFDDVEVRKRYRSFTSLDEVAFVIVVREHVMSSPDSPPPGPVRRAIGRVLWLPILNYTDGYGVTFGARASFVDLIGNQGRVSVPLTWGGTRQAAVQLEKGFTRSAVDRVLGGVSISQSENPHYEVDDRRVELSAGAEKALARHLRAAANAGWTDVEFGGLDDRFVRYGADLVLDTRANPAFPRNAVLLRGGWSAASPREGPTINRYSAEGRGYVGLFGSVVLSARALYERADRATPPYLQVLVGGADSLRGFRAGAFAGDNRFVSSAEVRVPLTSPLRVGQAGIDVFFDAATAYADGERLRDAEMHYGTGAGVFLLFPIVQLNMDIARGSQGDWRVHVMTGFRF